MDKFQKRYKGETLWGDFVSFFFYFLMVCFVVGDFGGGGRVRTRNTLHIVGARKSSICYDAVERRKRKREKYKI